MKRRWRFDGRKHSKKKRPAPHYLRRRRRGHERERERENKRERDGERERERRRERERDGEKIIEDALNGNFTSSFRSRSERKRTSVQSLFQTTATGASVSFPPQ